MYLTVTFKLSWKFLQVFINNEWHKCVSGKTFPVYNPATGEAIANVQASDKVSIMEDILE